MKPNPAMPALLLAILAAPAGCVSPVPTGADAHTASSPSQVESTNAMLAEANVTPETPHTHATAEHSGTRVAHVRVWGEDRSLLHSTWDGEEGLLTHLDPNAKKGPMPWPRVEAWDRPLPLWDPLLPMLSRAPPNATVRVEGYVVPDTRLEEVAIPRVYYFAQEGAIPRRAPFPGGTPRRRLAT